VIIDNLDVVRVSVFPEIRRWLPQSYCVENKNGAAKDAVSVNT
jgi:hypothetical protein